MLAGSSRSASRAPAIAQRLGDGLDLLALQAGAGRDPVTISTIGDLFLSSRGARPPWSLAPVLGACALAAIVINVAAGRHQAQDRTR